MKSLLLTGKIDEEPNTSKFNIKLMLTLHIPNNFIHTTKKCVPLL